ncbi:High-affinity branched-chain amino acid transport system permease protein LivH [bacterium HR29]|jgi:branched-chain amino acid transport system permease protein|nr:High-affinity branched-chain amino acid transport system permease protein LivH [bacterium HR29]
MTDFIQLVLAGAADGAIYGLLALALVLIYRSTHIVNFGQGEMAMFATYLSWSLLDAGVPFWGAFFAAIVIAFFIGIIIHRVLIHPLEGSPELTIVIVTLGIYLFFNSIALWIYSGVPKVYPIPAGVPRQSWEVGGVFIVPYHVTIFAILFGLMMLLFAFFRFTKVGLAMRAAAAQPLSSTLVGISVPMMMMLGWGIAAAAGATAGMLSAPIVVLEPNFMATILIFSFASAVLGGLDSPVGAVLGGFIVGEVSALGGRYIEFIGNDLQIVLAFALIVLVLLFRPAGLLGRPQVVRV